MHYCNILFMTKKVTLYSSVKRFSTPFSFGSISGKRLLFFFPSVVNIIVISFSCQERAILYFFFVKRLTHWFLALIQKQKVKGGRAFLICGASKALSKPIYGAWFTTFTKFKTNLYILPQRRGEIEGDLLVLHVPNSIFPLNHPQSPSPFPIFSKKSA